MSLASSVNPGTGFSRSAAERWSRRRGDKLKRCRARGAAANADDAPVVDPALGVTLAILAGTISVTTANGSPNLTAVGPGMVAGAKISGAGIPANTTILSYNPGAGTAVMSANATAGATISATMAPGKATIEKLAIGNQDLMRLTGGKPTPNGLNNRLYMPCVTRSPEVGGLNGYIAEGALTAWAWTAETGTQSSELVFKVHSFTSRSCRVRYNGRYIDKAPRSFPVGNTFSYVIVSVPGNYDPKSIVLEADTITGLTSILHEPIANITRPQPVERLIMMGGIDSWTPAKTDGVSVSMVIH